MIDSAPRLAGWCGPFWTISGADELFGYYRILKRKWMREPGGVASAIVARAINNGPHEGHFRITTANGDSWDYRAEIPIIEKQGRIAVLFPDQNGRRQQLAFFVSGGTIGEEEIVHLINRLLAEAKKMLGEPASEDDEINHVQ